MAIFVAYSFGMELEAMGVVIPPNTNQVKIVLGSFSEPVMIVFRVRKFSDDTTRYYRVNIFNSSGDIMTSQEFYRLAKEPLKLPDECVSLEILAEIDNIPILTTVSALETTSMKFLEGCTFA